MGPLTEGVGAVLIRSPRRKQREEQKGGRAPLGREPEQRQLVLIVDTLNLSQLCVTP